MSIVLQIIYEVPVYIASLWFTDYEGVARLGTDRRRDEQEDGDALL